MRDGEGLSADILAAADETLKELLLEETFDELGHWALRAVDNAESVVSGECELPDSLCAFADDEFFVPIREDPRVYRPNPDGRRFLG